MFSFLIHGALLPDTEQGLVAKALEMNCSAIASYSIIPASTRISLEILDHGEEPRAGQDGRGEGSPTTPTQPLPHLPIPQRQQRWCL